MVPCIVSKPTATASVAAIAHRGTVWTACIPASFHEQTRRVLITSNARAALPALRPQRRGDGRDRPPGAALLARAGGPRPRRRGRRRWRAGRADGRAARVAAPAGAQADGGGRKLGADAVLHLPFVSLPQARMHACVRARTVACTTSRPPPQRTHARMHAYARERRGATASGPASPSTWRSTAPAPPPSTRQWARSRARWPTRRASTASRYGGLAQRLWSVRGWVRLRGCI
jgi:hypothetical protein